nr:restriction endonuclease subunit S [bacterium]
MKIPEKIKKNSWEKFEFSEIADLSKKKINPQTEKENIKCIELEHIEKETGRQLGNVFSKEQLSTKNVFYKNDVLFGKLRPNLRKYIHCKHDGVCSSEIWVLRSKKGINSKFLFYLVQTERFIKAACVTSG